ncbi:hypothetical protein BCR44DRAFT_369465 [Catenaria anguillulae PL171]|uniref:Uncharacterized protein n=1 Tax=Catenaria anguillulae PL171 TaxID=765915 RepID=A0A1Y2H5D8_9FUNG|nr:hypothetical protein BCR44DRAFT_369465 [Catenaria anguillulae PL171]
MDLQPSTRKQFARGTELLALLVTIVLEVMAIVGIAQNAYRLDTAGWQTVVIYHPWSAGFIVALPLLCIGSSIFSLRFIWTTKLDSSQSDPPPRTDLNASANSPSLADSPSSTAERSATTAAPAPPHQPLTHTQRLLKPILSVLVSAASF